MILSLVLLQQKKTISLPLSAGPLQNALCRVFLFRLSLFVHIHFVDCLLKARSEITLALTPSKAIWVDKPEHALEVNEIIGLIPGFLSQTSLHLSDWKMVYEIKSRFILLLHKADTRGSD